MCGKLVSRQMVPHFDNTLPPGGLTFTYQVEELSADSGLGSSPDNFQMEFPSKQRCQQDDWNVLKGLVQRMTREDNFQESEDINLQIQ